MIITMRIAVRIALRTAVRTTVRTAVWLNMLQMVLTRIKDKRMTSQVMRAMRHALPVHHPVLAVKNQETDG